VADQEIENLIVRLQAEIEQYRKEMGDAIKQTDLVNDSVQDMNKALESTQSISDKAANAVNKVVSTLQGLDAKFKAVGNAVKWFGGELTWLGGIVVSTLGADIILDSTQQLIQWATSGAKGARATAIGLERLTRDTKLTVSEMDALKWYSEQTGVSLDKLLKNIDKMPDSVKKWAGSAAASNLLMTSAEVRTAKIFNDSLNLLIRTAQRVGQVVSSAIFPVLIKWANDTRKVAAGVLEFVSNNQELIRTIFTYAAKLVAIGGTIAFVGKLIGQFGGIFSLLATAVSLVTGLFGTFFSLILAIPAPLLLLLAAGAGVAAMFVNWKSIIPGSLAEVKSGFFSMVASVREVLQRLWEEVTSSFDAIMVAIKAGDLAAAGKVAWALVYLEWVKGTNALKEVWSGVKDYFISVWDSFPTWFVDLFESPIQSIKELFSIAFNWIKMSVGSLGETIAESLLNAVLKAVNTISNALAGSMLAELSGLRGGVLETGLALTKGLSAMKEGASGLASSAREPYEAAVDSRNRRLSEREAARANGIVSDQEKQAQAAKRALEANLAEVSARGALEEAQKAAKAAHPTTTTPKLQFKPGEDAAQQARQGPVINQSIQALGAGSAETQRELANYRLRLGAAARAATKGAGTGPWVEPPGSKPEDKTLGKLSSINDGIKQLVEAAKKQQEQDALNMGDLNLSGANLA
jgi:hypothetical protein